MLDRDVLSDHPTHRRADHVSGVDLEVIEEADGVERHVGERVRNGRSREVGERRFHHRLAVDDDTVELGRETAIPVVEPHDVKSTIDELSTERIGPRDQLGREAHHEKDRRASRVTHDFEFEFDGSDVGGDDGARHATTITHAMSLN